MLKSIGTFTPRGRRSRNHLCQLLLATTGFMIAGVGNAAATDLYWNGTANVPVAGGFGGSGTWQSGRTNWTDGSQLYSWTDGDSATFGGQASGTVNIVGQQTVENMTFSSDGYLLTGGALTVNGTVNVGPSVSTTIASSIDGTANLVVDGNLTLTGYNTYSGGTTVHGRLVLDNGSVSSPITTDQATLLINSTGTRSQSITIDLNASAFGITSNGDLTLDGKITASSTIMNVATSGGSLTLNADLTLDQYSNIAIGPISDPITLNGTISGSGTLNLLTSSESPPIYFTGSSWGYDGQIEVSGGNIYFGTNAVLKGDFRIFGAVVSGDFATLGNVGVNDGAILDTTSKSGYFNRIVVDEFVITTGGTLRFTADPNSNSASYVVANQDVGLQGGTVDVPDKLLKIGNRYVFLQTTASISGQALSVNQPQGAMVAYTLDYSNPKQVALVVNDDRARFFEACSDTIVGCRSLLSTRHIDIRSDFATALVWLAKDELDEALNNMSGDVYASTSAAMIENSLIIADATGRRLRDSLGGIAGGTQAPSVSNYAAASENPAFDGFSENDSGIGIWLDGYGNWSKLKGENGAASMTNDTGGFLIGADFAAAGSMRFGALGGFGASTYKADDHGAKSTSNDFTFGVYGGGEWGGFGTTFGAAYTWHTVDANRSLYFSTFNESLSSSYDAGTFQLYGGVGYTFDISDTVRLEPYADASYINQSTGSFNETGGLAALSHEDSNATVGFTTLGLRAAASFATGTAMSQITGAIGWRHGYGDLRPEESVQFSAGGGVFDTFGTPIAEDTAVVSIGWQTSFSERVDVGIDYTGQFGNGAESQTVAGKLSLRF